MSVPLLFDDMPIGDTLQSGFRDGAIARASLSASNAEEDVMSSNVTASLIHALS
jgi:hypothetical protein